jgi:hypothetical protein
MKTIFIKENILCTLSKAEIGYLNYLLGTYDETAYKRGKYVLQIMKENNYFYKTKGIYYQVLKIK